MQHLVGSKRLTNSGHTDRWSQLFFDRHVLTNGGGYPFSCVRWQSTHVSIYCPARADWVRVQKAMKSWGTAKARACARTVLSASLVRLVMHSQ